VSSFRLAHAVYRARPELRATTAAPTDRDARELGERVDAIASEAYYQHDNQLAQNRTFEDDVDVQYFLNPVRARLYEGLLIRQRFPNRSQPSAISRIASSIGRSREQVGTVATTLPILVGCSSLPTIPAGDRARLPRRMQHGLTEHHRAVLAVVVHRPVLTSADRGLSRALQGLVRGCARQQAQ
jgi:hypothetical protein